MTVIFLCTVLCLDRRSVRKVYGHFGPKTLRTRDISAPP